MTTLRKVKVLTRKDISSERFGVTIPKFSTCMAEMTEDASRFYIEVDGNHDLRIVTDDTKAVDILQRF